MFLVFYRGFLEQVLPAIQWLSASTDWRDCRLIVSSRMMVHLSVHGHFHRMYSATASSYRVCCYYQHPQRSSSDHCSFSTRYKAFARRLAERGFVTFAPHNPYRGADSFRHLQRLANPIGLSLFSIIIEQHKTILEWLASLRFVDEKRIGFYGLSYGGKSAMRIPAILTQ